LRNEVIAEVEKRKEMCLIREPCRTPKICAPAIAVWMQSVLLDIQDANEARVFALERPSYKLTLTSGWGPLAELATEIIEGNSCVP